MDSQFRIPGTNFRFGLDPIIGLIPGLGDFATFIISGIMVLTLAKNGASGFVLARMILNVILDTLVGAIPILGDLFDFAFQANQRNLKLMKEHYQAGRHQGSALKVIIPVLIILFLVVAAIVWGSYEILKWLYNLL